MTSVGRNEQPTVKAARSAPVLPWMRLPVSVTPGESTPLDAVGGLHPVLKTTLRERLSIDSLFPVQSTVWRLTAGGMSGVHDICISAPTGSGKTLAYALPIVNALVNALSSTRKKTSSVLGSQSHRPQALFLLPTRDLALQVYSVLQPLCDATGLTCSTACGTVSPPREALRVVECDLLVATPGRLMTHVNGTPGLSLSFLKFMVIDEADRLLRQSYHEWVKILRPVQSSANARIVKVVKFVVSATLTKDPSKLERLGLNCPRFVAMVDPNDYRYKLPPRLDQSRWVVPETKKPQALVTLLAAILQKYNATTMSTTLMIFSSSLTTTHRLAVLLRAVVEDGALDFEVKEYSGALPAAERAKALERLGNQHQHRWTVIVCSDAMSRGMDVDVGIVINYDAPVYAKTYVHRAGRTARAGKAGKVITLLARQEVRHFKRMMCKAEGQDGEGKSRIKEDTTVSVLSAESVQRLEQAVNSALPRLFVQEGSVVNNKVIHDVGTKGKEAKLGERKKKRLRVAGVPEIKLLT
jgi:ATP-dependent RNA helicase DDX51/DBP6